MSYSNSKSGFARNGFLFLLLLMPVAASAKAVSTRKDKVPADRTEAEKWITETTHRIYHIDRLDDQYLLYSSWDGRTHFGIALARISSIRDEFDTQQGYEVKWRDSTHDKDDCMPLNFSRRAEKFAAALEYLANAAREQLKAREGPALQQFAVQAKAWREANPKPQMPEEARQHKVLAEYAFQQKNAQKAIAEYTDALNLFPCWPEGQFNLAVLAGEQKDYATAVLHMKEYLELMPDAPDAQTGRDNIIIWQDQLTEAAATPVSSPRVRRK